MKSIKEAKATLASSKEEFDIGALEKFEQWESEMQKDKEEIIWVEEESLPKGWKVPVGLEEGKEILVDEEGTRFEGRKAAIDQYPAQRRLVGR